MDKTYLDDTRNNIKLSGEIDENYVINNGVRITFAEGSTFQGATIAAGTEFYNDSYIPQMFQQLSSGKLTMIPAAMDRPGTPYPSAPSGGGFAPDDNEDVSGSGDDLNTDKNNETDVSITGCCGGITCAIF